jgi:hypothetical protein
MLAPIIASIGGSMDTLFTNDNSLRTNAPRALTDEEVAFIRDAGRVQGIRLHIRWTHSTLRAAALVVDAIFENWEENNPARRWADKAL